MRKPTLNPTDRTIFLRNANLFNLNMWRISSPGIIVKKRKPKICLIKGKSNNIAASVTRRSKKIIKRYFFKFRWLKDMFTY